MKLRHMTSPPALIPIARWPASLCRSIGCNNRASTGVLIFVAILAVAAIYIAHAQSLTDTQVAAKIIEASQNAIRIPLALVPMITRAMQPKRCRQIELATPIGEGMTT